MMGYPLAVGWLDASIGTLIRGRPVAFSGLGYVLVTSLDSAIDISESSIGREIAEQYPECTFLGNGLVVPWEALPAIAEQFNLFNGFDEIWCFEHMPEVAKPLDFCIVAPLDLSSEPAPPLLSAWMERSGCVLGLGDGVGLNYVTGDPEIPAALVRLAEHSE